MDEHRQDETASERKARELCQRLFSYEYLKAHGLLQEPPRPEPPDGEGGGGEGGGPPFAGAMAMPIPEDESEIFRSYPATVIPARRRARR